MRKNWIRGALLIAVTALPAQTLFASSHREAPFIARMPKVDGTDFYMFASYETGRAGYTTFLANYQPLQSPYGGPNYFTMDPDAIYEIHIDNGTSDPTSGAPTGATADGIEDITFQFDFDVALANGGTGFTLPVGPAGNTKDVAIALGAKGPISGGPAPDADQNVIETYGVKIIRGDRRTGTSASVTKAGGGATFEKPMDNIGAKTFAPGGYAAYANGFVFDIDIPGCNPPPGEHGRVFVGQREEGFAVNLGQIFDLVNLAPQCVGGGCANVLGPQNQDANIISDDNVTSIALEVPTTCLTQTGQPIIGGWTTASVRQARVINPTGTFDQPSREGGPWVQVSRLGNPLVNEVVIGLKDKDFFNGSEPKDDLQNFADYVTNPTLPELIEILFGGAGVQAPNNFPRGDLVEAFVTGLDGGLGVLVNGAAAEYIRLNTDQGTLGPPTARGNQFEYGAAGCVVPTADGYLINPTLASCDPHGFPNGRRPGDDVVDLAVRVAMGVIAGTNNTPTGQLGYVDGAGFGAVAGVCDPVTRGGDCDAMHFQNVFPYLNTPFGGAP